MRLATFAALCVAIALSLFTAPHSHAEPVSAPSASHAMPVGIPDPGVWGVFHPITSPLPSTTTGCPAWPSGESSECYYVDNNHPAATDSANTYGYPDRPRISYPVTLGPGSIVEIRGGPYTLTSDNYLTLDGSATDPIYFYGVGETRFVGDDQRLYFEGSYFVVDGFVFDGLRTRITDSDHAVLRHTELDGGAGVAEASGLTLVGGNTDVVVYDIESHHFHIAERDGLLITPGSERVWVLDSEFHHNTNAGLQFCHACTVDAPNYIYIGGNVAYGNRETGFVFKYGNNIVLSQNVVYNSRPAAADEEFCFDDGSGCVTAGSGGDGSGIIVGADGYPTNVWVIYNEVYDSYRGIRIEEAVNGYVIGNVIHDIEDTGIIFEKTGEGPDYIAYNTISNAAVGIAGPWQGGPLETHVNNNVIADISGNYLEYTQSQSRDGALVTNNLFHNDGGAISIRWNGTATQTSGAGIDAAVGGIGNLIGDPGFTDPAGGDLTLTLGSAAIDSASSTLSDYDAAFRATFSVNVTILRDPTGLSRPQGSGFDIGAFEYDQGGTGNRFVDVPSTHFFFDDVEWLAEQGITLGCNTLGDLFCPDDSVTRGQMAAFLVRALDYPPGPPGRFTDDSGTFEADIEALAAQGVTLGCNPTGDMFCPNDPVTRGQMAAFLVRALDYPPGPTGRFTDDDGSGFEDEIEALAAQGVTLGCNPAGDMFCPNYPVTRGQMAAFLYRALGD